MVNPPDKHAPSKSLDGEGGVADPEEGPAHPQHPVLPLQDDGSPRPPQVLKKPEMHRREGKQGKQTPLLSVSFKPGGEENLLSNAV